MCDCLTNLQIPDSTNNIVVVRPAAKTFITGLASAYEEEYDHERLSPYIGCNEY